MVYARMVALCVFGFVCSAQALFGQDLSRYRDFALGSDLASVSAVAGVPSSEAKTVHQRPAVLQDLEWRPSYRIAGTTTVSKDPVEKIVLSFYNDQLFRVVVDYARERTQGMTRVDMIEAVSEVYGPPLPRTPQTTDRAPSRLDLESGSPVVRWGDREHAFVLYEMTLYGTTYRLMVTDTHLADLARKAASQAVRLDEQEAPSREVARQKKERDDARDAAEKARGTNKSEFRP